MSEEGVKRRSHAAVAVRSVALAVGMFGFGYLMVPIYDIMCEITGLNGKTGRVSVAEVDEQSEAARKREITVEFVASVNQGASWDFEPNVKTMKVTPGQLYNTSYFAQNLSANTVVGQATPSVSPFAAAKYFNKTECFCFTRQVFEGNGSRDMPLTFIIDEDIPVNVDRITLSYTFFKSPDQTT